MSQKSARASAIISDIDFRSARAQCKRYDMSCASVRGTADSIIGQRKVIFNVDFQRADVDGVAAGLSLHSATDLANRRLRFSPRNSYLKRHLLLAPAPASLPCFCNRFYFLPCTPRTWTSRDSSNMYLRVSRATSTPLLSDPLLKIFDPKEGLDLKPDPLGFIERLIRDDERIGLT